MTPFDCNVSLRAADLRSCIAAVIAEGVKEMTQGNPLSYVHLVYSLSVPSKT